ncbi:MAG: hypothetical protein JWQ24_1480 [Tardiphaga sp.]|nr:hypothetical protein [Tardiphaga sp.]
MTVCLAVLCAAVAAIVGRDSGAVSFDTAAVSSVAVTRGPVSNRENKKDRLVAGADAQALLANDPLRQAFASDSPLAGRGNTVLPPIVIPSQQPAKPKLGSPPAQKNYSLLSDAQIAAIKGRLNLTAAQQQNWPAVEEALRAVARKIHVSRQVNSASSPPIDPASAEVQQLKSAAMPLLFQLREDQKREVRSLARLIGLNAVASAI